MIRRAMGEDAEAIAQVETRAWRHAYADIIDPQFLAELDPAVRTAEWREYLERPDRTIVVAEVEGRVVGYASVRDDGNLRTLYVDPPAQGAGVGTQLLAEAERTGARELDVLEANGHGRRFYEARGWRDAGPGEDTLDRPTCRYVKP